MTVLCTYIDMEISYSNITVDSTSPTFVLSPSDWTSISSSGIAPNPANNSLISDFVGDLNAFYNSSLSVTTNQGAMVNITFQGELLSYSRGRVKRERGRVRRES
jgi:hypothetical protein